MEQDVALFRDRGADGIVIGALTRDGSIDKKTCQRLIAAAAPLPVTFHRAFDLALNPSAALEDVVSLGCQRLLTSGQASDVEQGLHLLKQLAAQAQGRIVVMPGGGVNEDNLATLIHTTGVRAVHASASCRVTSAMQVRSVAMGPAESDVGSWNECSYNRVRKLVDIAAECSQ